MPPRRRSQTAPRHRTKPDALAKAVGARVRKLRTEKGWSFDAFVEECGLGRGYISELERGLVVPTVTSLAKLAAALEVTFFLDAADAFASDAPPTMEELMASGRTWTGENIQLWAKYFRARAALASIPKCRHRQRWVPFSPKSPTPARPSVVRRVDLDAARACTDARTS
jgi:transcriptional regulator with XRE-family HTH domain